MIINNLEVKTSSKGGTYKTFETEGKKASAWANPTNIDWFNSILEGADVEGVLVQNDKGYWNLKAKLEPPSFIKRASSMTQAMDRKEESIGKFQDNKEYAVRLSGTFRDATLVTTESMKGYQEPDYETRFKDNWVKWRKWLWEHYEATNGERKDLTSDGGELPPF